MRRTCWWRRPARLPDRGRDFALGFWIAGVLGFAAYGAIARWVVGIAGAAILIWILRAIGFFK